MKQRSTITVSGGRGTAYGFTHAPHGLSSALHCFSEGTPCPSSAAPHGLSSALHGSFVAAAGLLSSRPTPPHCISGMAAGLPRLARGLRATILLSVLLFALAACQSQGGKAIQRESADAELVAAPNFNADSALSYIVRQCDFGPRLPGSAAHDACGDWIEQQFAAFGATVREHRTTVRGFGGVKMPCRNIMAHIDTAASTRILITAHWDSRAWADNDPDEAQHHSPVPAANDGASGVAVMLEMARAMSTSPAPVGVDFVCFDVEDQGHPQWAEDDEGDDDEAGFWCLGSRAWAEEAFARGYKAVYAVNLDMVGGRGARFCVEGYSRRHASAVVDLVWRTAAQLGHGALFPTSTGGYVMDDHVPLIQLAGIPAVDIIPNVDGARSSFGPTWHTIGDTPEAIDPAVLGAVGQTLLHVVYASRSAR